VASAACQPHPSTYRSNRIEFTHRPSQPVPPTNEPRNLLERYSARDSLASESERWRLPFQSQRIVAALLIAAARDDLTELRVALTPDAQWGGPGTWQLDARPVFADDDGHAFLLAFRKAAERFPAQVRWNTPPLPPAIQELVRSGAEPMWSMFANGNDLIVFREVLYADRARIDYVGFYPDGPRQVPPAVLGYGPPPPIVPPLHPRSDGSP
jgi:hypothetical protein